MTSKFLRIPKGRSLELSTGLRKKNRITTPGLPRYYLSDTGLSALTY